MFGISLPELFIIACVVLVLVKPSDLPIIAKYYKIIFTKLTSLKKEAQKLYNSVHKAILGEEEDNEEEKKFIRGQDGKLYEAFDIKDLKIPRSQKSPKKKIQASSARKNKK
jgi:Sec-independent protein translocase protein TatA